MKLKPIPPVEYDGSVDSKAFHCFITEGTAYVKDGEVPSKKQAFILSHYLKGKAHEFYVREVSGDPYRWRLSTFFRELFNYCFPVDFRIKLRKKLHTCYQGSRTVRDYLYELNEMWNMIGETDERTKVHKLWFGLRKEIQHDLWWDKLNPEISSLRAVIASAEIIEIAQSVTGGGPESKNKRRENPPVVRSAAMTPDGERRRKRERGCSAKKNDRKDYRGDQQPQAGPSQPRQEKRYNKPTDRKVGKASRPKMSSEEQERHKAEGLCFICHKSGHFSRNCPERNKVASTSSKPPGVASFGIDLDFGDIENQRELSTRSRDCEVSANNIHVAVDANEDDENAESDDLPENNELDTESDIVLSDLGEGTSTEEDSRSYNPWIGDPLGYRAEERLTGICYPGDDPLSPGVFDHTRFCIYPVEGERHIVVESERDELGDDHSIHIPDDQLRDPHFDVA